MILVYEHASHGSLDRQLNSCDLTWPQRLKICIDAAKGLSYLHDPKDTHQRLIHCDMKSTNILLDDHWNAKVSDFGLSIMGPANEKYSVIITFAAGTLGYCDPQYAMTHTLTKESGVYSFGVVLFEVLFGTLCCTYRVNGDLEKNLVPTWIRSYEEKKLTDIIFKSPTIEPLEQSALEIFSDIAYRCLEESREDRPELAEVVAELESALESQEFHESQKLQENQEFKREWNKQRSYYEKISKTAEPPLKYRSKGSSLMAAKR
ncbi:receptor-like protein kinase THESEUS 1 [Bidens hawaiensis]|uniref:receptor-like protein kinase THESEUS 1 n=1 Tax=Bidens hawaiensis TaxID=980011 RepID=UPI00404B3EF1